ncbi:hypothetical protein [Modestobacter sp. VKM Ac-2984]|uniref:hypothetical protein n=1 Tax=Modestobacter sp. VKM Ac-2984 TaxID=3004138 RepID=UPI0022AA2B05|nr:hypothetical protein [Modestobacter sp. VKM Ac-2984]MCZ2815902.1 hypothetical protein [Modestobacter sp. VKM Ac-2984]
MADDDLTPFTPAGAERLRTAAAELAAAVTAHAEAVTAVTGDAGMPEVFAASDRLLPAVLAYADAQFDLTGNDFPFGVLHGYAEDDGEDDGEDDEPQVGDAADGDAADGDGADGDGADGGTTASGTTDVSVLQRHDLRVTDEAAVLAAGRRAYLRSQPDGDAAAAVADVTDLGRALSQLADAGGWDAVGETPGLRTTGRSVLVIGRELAPGADPEDDTEDDGGELLWSQQDVFPG